MPKMNIPCKFGQAPNELLNDPTISFKAKGLYTFMQSKPDQWDFTIAKIASQAKEGIDAIKGAIKELKSAGYLSIKNFQNKEGKWDSEYTLYFEPRVEKPTTVKPTSVFSDTVKPTIISKKDTSKKDKEERRGKEQPTAHAVADPSTSFPGQKNIQSLEVSTLPDLIKELDPTFHATPYMAKLIEFSRRVGSEEARARFIRFVFEKKASRVYEFKNYRFFLKDFQDCEFDLQNIRYKPIPPLSEEQKTELRMTFDIYANLMNDTFDLSGFQEKEQEIVSKYATHPYYSELTEQYKSDFQKII